MSLCVCVLCMSVTGIMCVDAGVRVGVDVALCMRACVFVYIEPAQPSIIMLFFGTETETKT